MRNSQVHLRGVKDPIEVSFEQAKKITEIFFNDKVDKNFVINVGDNSFRKSEIRYVRKIMDKPDGVRTHWIIRNTKRDCIWKQPYLSFVEAKAEFDLQVSSLAQNQTHSFVIEKISDDEPDNYTKSLTETSKRENIDKDFSDFDEITQDAFNKF